MTVARQGSQRPRLQRFPAARAGSAGPDAIEFAQRLGYELDDWQEWCIDGLLSEDPLARLCATTSLIIVSRQNGKNVVLEVVELYAFYVLGWQMILHTAHLQDTSAMHMQRLQSIIEADPDLDAITRFSPANGKERMYRTDTGATIRFITRGKKTARGHSPQMVVFDEALHLNDDQIQAIVPSLSAQSMRRDKPLQIFTSSAPLEESLVLHRVRDGFAKGTTDGFFAEWSVELTSNLDITDRDGWFDANPGMGVRINDDWVAATELAILSREAFMAERLGIPISGPSGFVGPISLARWTELADPNSTIVGPASIAIDVSPDFEWATVAAAGYRSDGHIHVEIGRRDRATEWVVPFCAAQGQVAFRVAPSSPAGFLIPLLRDAAVDVIEVSPQDVTQSMSRLISAVVEGTIHHLGSNELSAAISNATVKTFADTQVWSRIRSSGDITALMAATIAIGGVDEGDPLIRF